MTPDHPHPIWDQLAVTGPVLPAPIPAVVHRAAAEPALPMRAAGGDSVTWMLAKTVAQLALVGGVLAFVLDGGREPLASGMAVATGLLLSLCIALTDRERFADRGATAVVVDVFGPMAPAVPMPSVPTLQSHGWQSLAPEPMRAEVT